MAFIGLLDMGAQEAFIGRVSMAFIHEGLISQEASIDFLTHIFNVHGLFSFTMLLVSGADVAAPINIDGEPFPWEGPEEARGEHNTDSEGGEEGKDNKSEEDNEEDKKDADHEHHFIAYDYDYWKGHALERCNICGEQRIVHSV